MRYIMFDESTHLVARELELSQIKRIEHFSEILDKYISDTVEKCIHVIASDIKRKAFDSQVARYVEEL